MYKQQPQPTQSSLLFEIGAALYREMIRSIEIGLDKKNLLPRDAEQKPRALAEEDFVQGVEHVRQLPRGARESTQGLPQTALDKRTHKRMAKALRKIVPTAVVAGEEADKLDWSAAEEAHKTCSGVPVFLLDAIDGSGPQDTTGFGYSVNVILYDTDTRPATPYLMVTVKDNGLMLGWMEGFPVQAAYVNVLHGRRRQPRLLTIAEPLAHVDLVNAERQRWIAAVAAQPKHRKLIEPLLAPGSPWTMSTYGGAPAMPGLVVDQLAALVISSNQTRHDAAPLLALAHVGGLHFLNVNTMTHLTAQEIPRLFLGIVRPTMDPAYKPIPPMVIARDPDIGLELATTLHTHLLNLEAQESAKTGSDDESGPRLRVVRSDKGDDR